MIPAPEWTKDLVIYEINPYAFTSPLGPGSGTFNSLRQKLPYLEELGITGIWLAGHSPATTHFYNIKTVYACLRPDRLDPDLGSATEFKAMIDEAHKRGIRIFLDVITHGVVNESPLLDEHPEWFNAGTWGMTDYNYDNAEFRQWWLEVWTNYALEFGVDGYRLDVPRHHQMPLWDEIAARCAAGGHPIVIFPERVTTYHFGQHDIRSSFSTDMAGEFSPSPQFVGGQISCHDEGWKANAGNYYKVKGHRANLAYALFGTNIPLFMAGEEFDAEQVSLPELEKNLFGGGGAGGWLYGSWIQWQQLEQPRHRDMLTDTQKMLRLRRENRDLIHGDRANTHILRLAHKPSSRPIPYARFLPGKKAIVVVTSHEDTAAVTYTLAIPLAKMGLDGMGSYRVTDLWQGGGVIVSEDELSRYVVTVPPNRTPSGGVVLLKIEPMMP